MAAAAANPFDAYLDALQGAVYPTPSPGFKARIYVLIGLSVYAILISSVYLAVTVIEYRRTNRKMWFWKLVQRSNGRYLLGNQSVLWAVFSIGCSGMLIGYNWTIYDIYANKASQAGSPYWRTLIAIPIFTHGWIASWAALQASILSTQNASGNHIIKPSVANFAYVGILLIGIILPNLVVSIRLGLKFRAVWSGYNDITALLKSAQAEFASTGVMNISVLGQVLVQITSYSSVATSTQKDGITLGIVYLVAIVFVIAINIAGLSLLLTLKKQIKFNLARFRDTTEAGSQPRENVRSMSIASINSNFSMAPPPQLGLASINQPQTPGVAPVMVDPFRRVSIQTTEFFEKKPGANGQRRTSGTNTMLRKSRQGSMGVDAQQQAKHLLAMKKVEWDLITFVTVIVSIGAVFFGLVTYMTVNYKKANTTWFWVEMPLTVSPWIYLMTITVATTGLVYNALTHVISLDPVPKTTGSASDDTNQKRRPSQQSQLFSDDNPFASQGAMGTQFSVRGFAAEQGGTRGGAFTFATKPPVGRPPLPRQGSSSKDLPTPNKSQLDEPEVDEAELLRSPHLQMQQINGSHASLHQVAGP